jgi:hypothetical protein
MKELMEDPALRPKAEKLAKFTGQIVDEANQMSEEQKSRQLQIGLVSESQTIKEAKHFFERELNAEVYVYEEEDPEHYDPKARAVLAKPYRPAIFIE